MAEVSNLTLLGTLATVLGTIVVTGITAFVTLRIGRRKEKSEVQVTLNEGFKILVSELQEERDRLVEVVKAQGIELTNLRGELRQAHQRIDSAERLLLNGGKQR